jgi:hypothetical protein
MNIFEDNEVDLSELGHKATADGYGIHGDSFTQAEMGSASVVVGFEEEGAFVYVEHNSKLFGAGVMCWEGYGSCYSSIENGDLGTSFWANGSGQVADCNAERETFLDGRDGSLLRMEVHADDYEESVRVVNSYLHEIIEAWNGKDNKLNLDDED